jgi:hypothetical protein
VVFLGFEGDSPRAQGSLFSDQVLQSGWWGVRAESVPQFAYTVYVGGQAGEMWVQVPPSPKEGSLWRF